MLLVRASVTFNYQQGCTDERSEARLCAERIVKAYSRQATNGCKLLNWFILKSDPGNTNIVRTCIKCFSLKVRQSTSICRYHRRSFEKHKHFAVKAFQCFFHFTPVFYPPTRRSDNIMIKSFVIHFMWQFQCYLSRGDKIVT